MPALRFLLSLLFQCALLAAMAPVLAQVSPPIAPLPALQPPRLAAPPPAPRVPDLGPDTELSAEARREAAQFLSTYKLGAGDVITVQVFGEEDLSRERIRITDSGTFFQPNVGELVVLDMTIGEVERLVVSRLKGRILVNPKVSVYVEEYRPFFINGMVERPGGYPFQPGLTVRKAAALAGGLRERAAVNKIFLIRGTDTQQKSQKVDLNSLVFPGDIVTVEESFF